MRHKNLRTSRIGLVAISLLLLAGCGGAELPIVNVPTLAEFPTLVNTFTPSPTVEASNTPTTSPSDAPTQTETLAPTPILSPTPSLTFTPSVTPSDTITPTPSETPTPIPPTATEAPTLGAVGSLLQMALQATVLPVTPFPQPAVPLPGAPLPVVTGVPPNCPQPPTGGFAVVYFGESGLPGLLGCPAGTDVNVITAVQSFERGMMVYVAGQPGVIYALTNDGRFRRFDDTWTSGVDPDSGGETPPVGLLEPVRGFGKVWRDNPDVRAGLGWAVSEEAGNESRQLLFERGRLIFLPQRNQTVALIDDTGGASGAWRLLNGGA